VPGIIARESRRGIHPMDFLEILADLPFGGLNIKCRLQVHPEVCGGAEGATDPANRLRSINTALTMRWS
jgi:hypothetical protein